MIRIKDHKPDYVDNWPFQRIYESIELPPRPKNFYGHTHWFDPLLGKNAPKTKPHKAYYLGTCGWSWSSMHSRIDAYYLNFRNPHWLLWVRDCEAIWWNTPDEEWFLGAYCLKRRAKVREASLYLIMDMWKLDAREIDLDHFHFIHDEGMLSVAEFRTIGRLVWPETVMSFEELRKVRESRQKTLKMISDAREAACQKFDEERPPHEISPDTSK
jgi:hypothetical protein